MSWRRRRPTLAELIDLDTPRPEDELAERCPICGKRHAPSELAAGLVEWLKRPEDGLVEPCNRTGTHEPHRYWTPGRLGTQECPGVTSPAPEQVTYMVDVTITRDGVPLAALNVTGSWAMVAEAAGNVLDDLAEEIRRGDR